VASWLSESEQRALWRIEAALCRQDAALAAALSRFAFDEPTRGRDVDVRAVGLVATLVAFVLAMAGLSLGAGWVAIAGGVVATVALSWVVLRRDRLGHSGS
jgi:membrane protease YdiL (CAAX protease family)